MTRNTRAGLMYPVSLTHWCSQEAASPDSTPLPKAHAHLNYNILRQHGPNFMCWEASKPV